MENKINFATLQQIVGGDEAMAQRLLELFKLEMPRQLATLEEQLYQRNLAGANITAHGIKGQLQMMGLDNLAAIAQTIEGNTEDGNMAENIMPLFEELKTQTTVLLNNESS